ncbi:DUF4142 domain-containing protein [Caenispirillum bisanense]|uniref:DUF4142 domain-containing protein n=1 Tax=Caenispirillum bisanense TaxID=414052 RepID=UPI0031D67143
MARRLTTVMATGLLTALVALPAHAQTEAQGQPEPSAEAQAEPGTATLESLVQAGHGAQLMAEAMERGMAVVAFSEQVAERGANAEVQTYAAETARDHAAFNDRLAALFEARGLPVPELMDTRDQQVLARMSTLEGQALDDAYVFHVARAHMRQYNTVKKLAAQTDDPDVRAAADEMEAVMRGHHERSQALRLDHVPVDQGPVGAAPEQAARPSEVTPQSEEAPYSDHGEGRVTTD